MKQRMPNRLTASAIAAESGRSREEVFVDQAIHEFCDTAAEDKALTDISGPCSEQAECCSELESTNPENEDWLAYLMVVQTRSLPPEKQHRALIAMSRFMLKN